MAQVDSFYHIFHRTNNPGMILQGHHWDFFGGPYPLYHSNSEIPPNPPVMTPYYRYVVTPQKVEQVINTISSRIYSTRNLRFCLFGVCSYISYINIYHILLCSVCFLYPAIVVSYYPYIIWLVVWNMFFPFSWECHDPNWRTPSLFRGVGWNHQPVIILWYIMIIMGFTSLNHGFQ